jgi:type II secretory pathway pseudopilin PulG
LVEVTIVLLIMAIVAAVAAPRMANSLSYFRADAAAKRIAVDIALAQRHAMTNSTAQTVQFITATNSYTLPGMKDINHPALAYVVKLADPPCESTLASAVFGADSIVIFDQYGLPDSGGSAVVRAGDHQRTITVDANTGKVTIQ